MKHRTLLNQDEPIFRPLLRQFAVLFILLATSWTTFADTVKVPQVDSKTFATEPLRLINGISGTMVTFTSHSPADYANIINGKLGSAVELSAQLFMPKNASSPSVPAVIINPGSGNIGPHHIHQAVTLSSAGIAALLIDPFYGRGITDTIGDQGQMSFAASTYDVLAAVQKLRHSAGIDSTRIGATGGSRGGTAVMMAIAAPLSEVVLGDGNGINTVVAGYPWCGVQFSRPQLAKGASLLVLHGDADDWVSPIKCQGAVQALQSGGNDAQIMMFPNALHAFDREGVDPTEIADATSVVKFHTLYINKDGQYFDPRSGKMDPSLTAKELFTYAATGGFIKKGVHIGSTGNQAVEYNQEMLTFFEARLLKQP
ncbi:prolyl oligopeptidase family serine peptidase [uncultured Paraglaciecola sp.]|uniref:dienelactone hydrolase family protein n=1 Tax=uncultured Paraglaciecola sp. TaxID=1765024 RepID=UPI0030D88D62|tara:strand:- start:5868 stop:6977 length:1110 start_codon:yes stop_codon:yes gene_type:complete